MPVCWREAGGRGDGGMALRTKKVGVGAHRVAEEEESEESVLWGPGCGGAGLRLPLKGFGRCGNLHLLLLRLKVWI